MQRKKVKNDKYTKLPSVVAFGDWNREKERELL